MQHDVNPPDCAAEVEYAEQAGSSWLLGLLSVPLLSKQAEDTALLAEREH